MNKTYLKNIYTLLEKLENTQEQTIDRVAQICAEAIAGGGLLYFFGTGHSHMICEEPFSGPAVLPACTPFWKRT